MATPKLTVSTEIIPYIFYRDVPAALDWLTRAFGFAETMRTATPNGGTHGEMTLDGQRIMMGQGSKEWRMVSAHEADAATQGIFVYLADVDAHYERAQAAGQRSSNRQKAFPTGAGTPPATPTGIPGSSRRLPPSADGTLLLSLQGLSCGTSVVNQRLGRSG
jgi:PhnB protein